MYSGSARVCVRAGYGHCCVCLSSLNVSCRPCLDDDAPDLPGVHFGCVFASADWQAVGPPHKQRYLQFTGQPAAAVPGTTAAAAANGTAAAAAAGSEEGSQPSPSAGSLLCAVQCEVFESGAFARLLRAMLDVQILQHAGEVRRFRAGKP
jgi:hypothetical protein